MLSDYHRELSTHYAQVRKRLWGEPPKPKIFVPPKPEPEPEPVIEPEPEPEVPPVDLTGAFKMIYSYLPWEKDVPELPKRRRMYRDVLADVSRETGVSAKEIMGRQRTKHIVDARRYFWWRVVEECPHLSINDIAKRSGHDHSTVLHAVGRYEEILSGEFKDFRDPSIPREAREREPNGRYVRRRSSGRKWCGLKGVKKPVD